MRKGRTFHGLALNVKMDLEPFSRINPCGLEGMQATQISNFYSQVALDDIREQIGDRVAIAFDLAARTTVEPWS